MTTTEIAPTYRESRIGPEAGRVNVTLRSELDGDWKAADAFVAEHFPEAELFGMGAWRTPRDRGALIMYFFGTVYYCPSARSSKLTAGMRERGIDSADALAEIKAHHAR